MARRNRLIHPLKARQKLQPKNQWKRLPAKSKPFAGLIPARFQSLGLNTY